MYSYFGDQEKELILNCWIFIQLQITSIRDEDKDSKQIPHNSTFLKVFTALYMQLNNLLQINLTRNRFEKWK